MPLARQLCVRLLPEPHNTETLKLLREYVQIRLDITQRVPSPAEFDAAVANSNRIQQQLWQQAMVMAAKDSGIVPTGLFIQSLNEWIDDQEKRLTAVVTAFRISFCSRFMGSPFLRARFPAAAGICD